MLCVGYSMPPLYLCKIKKICIFLKAYTLFGCIFSILAAILIICPVICSFVSPKWVKQMSDGADVMKNLHRAPDVNYPVLIPNVKGYEIAVSPCTIYIIH